MKTVLICLDSSHYSLNVATEGIFIAKCMNANISLIYAVSTIENSKPLTKEKIESGKFKAKRFIEKILNSCSCAALICIEEGDPFDVFIERAKILKADYIVIGNEGGTKSIASKIEYMIKRLKISITVI